MIDIQSEDWLSKLLPKVVELAREAGWAVMAIYGQVSPTFEDKVDHSPLTQADLVSHELIVEGLTRLSPEWPILSEESKEVPFELRSSWYYFWLVDPLDGTKEFLSRNGEFTVNIALIQGTSPILGVVYAPALNRMYFAGRKLGAYRTVDEVTTRIKTGKHPEGIQRVVVSRSHLSDEETLDVLDLESKSCEFLAIGSSLKFCLVAEGSADLYPRSGSTMEWDTAAGECILVEAGGAVTHLDGRRIEYNKPILRQAGFVATARS